MAGHGQHGWPSVPDGRQHQGLQAQAQAPQHLPGRPSHANAQAHQLPLQYSPFQHPQQHFVQHQARLSRKRGHGDDAASPSGSAGSGPGGWLLSNGAAGSPDPSDAHSTGSSAAGASAGQPWPHHVAREPSPDELRGVREGFKRIRMDPAVGGPAMGFYDAAVVHSAVGPAAPDGGLAGLGIAGPWHDSQIRQQQHLQPPQMQPPQMQPPQMQQPALGRIWISTRSDASLSQQDFTGSIAGPSHRDHPQHHGHPHHHDHHSHSHHHEHHHPYSHSRQDHHRQAPAHVPAEPSAEQVYAEFNRQLYELHQHCIQARSAIHAQVAHHLDHALSGNMYHGDAAGASDAGVAVRLLRSEYGHAQAQAYGQTLAPQPSPHLAEQPATLEDQAVEERYRGINEQLRLLHAQRRQHQK
ncbi:hypothetical protein HK105_205581 [Polyrhizophydium stewartii]|uniref:Uncharacterized protein n=1 Tax=Polyrhizophydium stewartii TaxID=2732419 RepID=A0ABR4N5U5_9FUNG